jgi:hypothetical protein
MTAFSPDCMNPDWRSFLLMSALNLKCRTSCFCDIFFRCRNCPVLALPPSISSSIQELFFPEGRESILDVSATSTFKYADELRELLPLESEKQFLMFDEVEHAFHRLMMSYIHRTFTLQKYGNALFRVHLLNYFRMPRLPSWLMSNSEADLQVCGASPSLAQLLTQTEVETPSPGDGLLLRTQSTTAEAFSRAPDNDVLRWDDSTEQLVRFILFKLFHPDAPHSKVLPGHRVCIHGMSAAFLNGAEGYYERLSPSQPGRVEVRLVSPAAVVHKVQSEKNTIVVIIPEEKIMRYPDLNDVVSFRRLRHFAAAGVADAAAWMEKFKPFLDVAGFALQRGPDPDITMSEVLERFKMSSYNICLGSTSFLGPICAYLERKLRHARQKLQPAISPAPKKIIKIFIGGEYYTLLSEGRSSKYILFKLHAYRAYGSQYLAKIELLNADGSSSSAPAQMIIVPDFLCFIPKEDFAEYLSSVADTADANFDSSFADTRDDYSSEAYNTDSGEILDCLVASFPEFKLHGKIPSRAFEKDYTLCNASKGSCLEFTEVDLGMSFKPFFSEDLTPSLDAGRRARLMKSAALEELNRCFFIHLGLALDIHPFALQVLLLMLRCVCMPFIDLACSSTRTLCALKCSLKTLSFTSPPTAHTTPFLQAIFREHSQLMLTRTKAITLLHRDAAPSAAAV